MAGDLNVVILVGRLTRDSEIRYSQKGDAIVRFSLAINRRKRNADGEDEVHYFNCVYFGKAAEAVNQYLTKGRQVAVNGELRQNRYEVEGQARSTVEIFVNSLQLIGSSQNTQHSNSVPFEPARQSSYSRVNSQYENRGRSQAPSQSMGSQSVDDSLENVDFSGGPENYGDDPIPF